MGYYTSYDLEVHRVTGKEVPKNVLVDIAMELAAVGDWACTDVDELSALRETLENQIDPIGFLISDDVYKWYDYEEDMRAIARKFPDYVFKLTGWGEERDDMWVHWFYQDADKLCKAQIVYDTPPHWTL